ncbi:MFS transporter [Virgisporangium ochraceum]|uniref:MFS transporter n=1 Tax=Virgisporangium ochraceum TaxID=65505 RepID=A0A8J3ZSA5_9ACTN|nr:MFS transporter [Virgisporangium ochraceum]GIJ68092.1 MFS transporter [Virgisporangium ochraceum]
MRAALRAPGFGGLVLVWTIINLADSMLFLTLAIWVKDLTGSDGAAGATLAALAVPALFAPLIGHLVDRFPRRRLVSIAALAAAASVLVLTTTDELWVIYAVTMVYAAVGYLLSAAQAGLVRDLLPDEHLAPANGLLTTVDQGLRLITPMAGAGLYVTVGMDAVIATTAALFVVAAVGMTAVRVTETAPATEREPFLREVTAGFRHLFGTPVLGGMTVALAVAIGVTGLTNTTNFAAIEVGLGSGPAMLAVLASVQGAGAVVGGLTAGPLVARWDERRTATVGLVLLGLGIAPTMGTSLALIVVGLLGCGIGVSLTVVSFVTLRQRRTPPTLQGRAAAASNMAFNVPQLSAALAATGLILVVDYRVLIGVTVAVILVAAAGIGLLRTRQPEDGAAPAPAGTVGG